MKSPSGRLTARNGLGRFNRSRGGCMPAGRSALVEGLGEPALGVDARGRTGAGGGDGLPVDVVDDVAAGEDTRDVGAGGGVLDLDVAGLVQLQLAGEQLAPRIVADGDEQP